MRLSAATSEDRPTGDQGVKPNQNVKGRYCDGNGSRTTNG
jgi:hypothetical protein